MPYVKNLTYCDIPFTSETARGDFYTYLNISQLAARSEMYKEDTIPCRTIGILHSSNGRFYLTDVHSPSIKPEEPLIQVSMVYIKSSPKSTVIPYPVQIFGTLQWKKRPVVIAKILQTLSTSMALRLSNILNAVANTHLARPELRKEAESEESVVSS